MCECVHVCVCVCLCVFPCTMNTLFGCWGGGGGGERSAGECMPHEFCPLKELLECIPINPSHDVLRMQLNSTLSTSMQYTPILSKSF